MRNGSCELKTTSGNVKVEFEEGFNLIKIKSASGDVKLALPGSSQFSLNVKSVSGNINYNDFPVQAISSDDRSLAGIVGKGHSKVDISTTSGND
jgi:DUF4097 and DUF4098 domain-containing protein YvlB